MENLPANDRELIREALRRVSHMRERKARVCEVCGRETPDRLPHARYCSGACRAAAFRRRQREKAARDNGGGVS